MFLYLDKLAAYGVAPRGELLDVDSDCEAFLAAARATGFNARGLAPGQNLDSPKLTAGSLDVCVAVDALGRAPDPEKFLRRIHQLLKPEAALLLAAAQESFDDSTLQNLLAKTGFAQIWTWTGKGHTPGGAPRGKCLHALARKQPERAQPLLSIVLPVYNEVATFKQVMALLAPKKVEGLDKEIILIESNSTDGTREAVEAYRGQPGIKIVLEDRPQGKGHAVRNGLAVATGDFLIIQDGDLEYDLDDYDRLLEPLRAYRTAFVLGSRHARGVQMRQFEHQRWLSGLMNLGHVFFTTLLNLFCGVSLKDPFTMYKVFRRDCLFNLHLSANRFDFDWELVIKLIRKGYRPIEIPVHYASRSFKQGKKVRFFRDPLSWIVALFRYRFGRLWLTDFAERKAA